MHIGRSEGLAGLQAGLALAVVREASKAFFRIGCFQPILDSIHDPSTGSAYATPGAPTPAQQTASQAGLLLTRLSLALDRPAAKRMVSGMSSGAIAAIVCNPIELVKTRQQSAGQAPGGHALGRLRRIYQATLPWP